MKKIISLLLIGVLVLSMAACSNEPAADNGDSAAEKTTAKETMKDTEKEAPAERVKLKVMILSEDSNRQAIYQDYYSAKIGDAFPNYDVEFELPGSAENYASKVAVYNASGTLPDVFWGGDVVYQAGNALPLTDRITENGFLDKFSNKAALIPAPDGEIYCLSSGTDSFFAGPIFYNKEIFEKEGLSMPNSYEELKTLVVALKEKGYVPISATAWALQNFMFADLVGADDGMNMVNLQNKSINFDDAAIVEGARKLQELTSLGAFPEDVTFIEHQVHEQLFIDGNAAMIYHPIWVYPAIKDAGFEIGFGYLPDVFGQKIVNAWGSATAGGFMVAKNSENPDAALEVAQWLCEQDADYWKNVAGNVTAMKGFDTLPDEAPEVNKFVYDKMLDDSITVIPNFQTNFLSQAGQAEYTTNIEKLVTNQITPEEFGKAMTAVYK